MSTDPIVQGLDDVPAFSHRPPPHFPQRVRLMLPALVASPRGTRFGMHTSQQAPLRESNVSLLLSVCGYEVRRGAGLTMRGATGRWLPVPSPSIDEPMLGFLQRVCACDWPLHSMDPNDERLDVVFAAESRAT